MQDGKSGIHNLRYLRLNHHTAGISGSIPKGLVIGTVEEINEEDTSIASYAVIPPALTLTIYQTASF
jgi:hypothetical protein